MGISPGGRPINETPLSASKTSNWVARAGGLPPYIRGVARGIAKNHGGEVTSRDIKIAIGKMKVWAAGGDNVTPPVQAAAAKALAEWEALRAKAHADLAHDIVHGLIDLAAVNKHHVKGTAFHWRHGYIPLDARTATLWKKKHFAERLAREGKLTSHEPEGVRNETDRRNAYATRPLSLHDVTQEKREAAKKAIEDHKKVQEQIAPPKPTRTRAPKISTPSTDSATMERRKAAADYAAALAPFGATRNAYPQTHSSAQHEQLDAAYENLKKHFPDLQHPGNHPFREDKGYSYAKGSELRAWATAHRKNLNEIQKEFADTPKSKSSYGLHAVDAKRMAAAWKKDPAKEKAKEEAKAATRRTDVFEVLRAPEKGDVLRFPAKPNPATGEKDRPGQTVQYGGTSWKRVQESAKGDGAYELLYRGRRFDLPTSTVQQLAEMNGVEHVNGKDVSVSSSDIFKHAADRRGLKNQAVFEDQRAANATPEKVSPALAEKLGKLDQRDTADEAQQLGYTMRIAETSTPINCQKATLAYELRRRGFDASAQMGSGGPEYDAGYYSWFHVPEGSDQVAKIPLPFKSGHADTAARGGYHFDLITQGIAEKHPIGSRGSIIVAWSNPRTGTVAGRHIFAWENTPKGVIFKDAQVNKQYDRDNPVWYRMHSPSGAEVFRADDKAILAKADVAVTSTKEHSPYHAKVVAAKSLIDEEKKKPYGERDYPKLEEAQKALRTAQASAKRKFYKSLGREGSTW